jgi:hypothetical protein
VRFGHSDQRAVTQDPSCKFAGSSFF